MTRATTVAAGAGVGDGEEMRGPRGMQPHPIHVSLIRPILFAGAEPAAVALEVGIAGALLFGIGFKLVTFAFALLYLTVGHGLLRWVAKHDPYMIQLYLRSLAGRDYYPPHGSAHAAMPAIRPSIARGASA